ncbi:MAG: hypothetical protein KatS3mg119_1880 [Rhodothalassiaceae bacterium]|nr:MAG: hypothetical protein KatS3mg119_1880 [Rhodothalassiaceae bacterium]
MPRVLSPTAAQAILASDSEEVFVVLVTIDHPSLVQPIRIANDTEPVVRSGGTWDPYPFEAVLPEDSDAAEPQVRLRVDNIDRQVLAAIRALDGPPTVTIEVVLASQPDLVEAGPWVMSVRSVEADALALDITLGHEEALLDQAVPAQTYTPGNSAGMFA